VAHPGQSRKACIALEHQLAESIELQPAKLTKPVRANRRAIRHRLIVSRLASIAPAMPLVRTARLDDAPAVLELWSSARSEHATITDRKRDIERLISETPSAMFVAEADGGNIVGVLIAGWDGWRGNMYRLAVHPDHRRQGIARRLLDAGEEHLAVSERAGSPRWLPMMTPSLERSGTLSATRPIARSGGACATSNPRTGRRRCRRPRPQTATGARPRTRPRRAPLRLARIARREAPRCRAAW
jgi:GNAT superfamily N-acetyltransferase